MKKNKIVDIAMRWLFTVCGFLSIIFVIVITAFLVSSGVPAIGEIGIRKFLFGTTWASTANNPEYGILPFILSSVYGTFGAILIGVPFGVLCAVFLAKSSSRKASSVFSSVIELMSGIPSVVYGLVGMIVIVPNVKDLFGLPDGANLFSAIIVLAIMILPSVISISQTAIQAVPHEYEEASLALGATKTETIFKVTLPAALGEAMAVMMVAGNVANMPSLFKSVRFLTTAVASEMSYSSGLQRQALFSIALVLFIFILLINIILNFVVKRERK